MHIYRTVRKGMKDIETVNKYNDDDSMELCNCYFQFLLVYIIYTSIQHHKNFTYTGVRFVAQACPLPW